MAAIGPAPGIVVRPDPCKLMQGLDMDSNWPESGTELMSGAIAWDWLKILCANATLVMPELTKMQVQNVVDSTRLLTSNQRLRFPLPILCLIKISIARFEGSIPAHRQGSFRGDLRSLRIVPFEQQGDWSHQQANHGD
jgi:hypothetical protein